ncbi:uncharacterized protein F5891DRAFT_979458 [Suillus fuscotomentosus]|uniref:Uncharacterized protein n=1 Tax=Suillus fuscotomentosus TaxID=1912939 RepID=A0AAD4E7P9_9AGAM|nr:uncharacterized protein F5891DRAFT_979458 [Suillus fuscotomentosus]KAG1901255.1 hypothetical protein F5891DRAFT_979458 [Suillus fuscotomentosus]
MIIGWDNFAEYTIVGCLGSSGLRLKGAERWYCGTVLQQPPRSGHQLQGDISQGQAVSVRAAFDSSVQSDGIALPYCSNRRGLAIRCKMPVPGDLLQGQAVSVRAAFDSSVRSDGIALPYCSNRRGLAIRCKMPTPGDILQGQAVSVRAAFDSSVRSDGIAVPYCSNRRGLAIRCKVISYKGRLSRFERPSTRACGAMVLQYHTAATAEVWPSVAI